MSFFFFNLQVSAGLAASKAEVGNVILLSLWRTFWNGFLLWWSEEGILVAAVLCTISWWFVWCVVSCALSTALGLGLTGSPLVLFMQCVLSGLVKTADGFTFGSALASVLVTPESVYTHYDSSSIQNSPCFGSETSICLSGGFHSLPLFPLPVHPLGH